MPDSHTALARHRRANSGQSSSCRVHARNRTLWLRVLVRTLPADFFGLLGWTTYARSSISTKSSIILDISITRSVSLSPRPTHWYNLRSSSVLDTETLPHPAPARQVLAEELQNQLALPDCSSQDLRVPMMRESRRAQVLCQ
jgi:hypothetical protein